MFQSAPERGLRGICPRGRYRGCRMLFQSAPERGLRGIFASRSVSCSGVSFNPPRSAGSGESHRVGCLPTPSRFQSAPERGLRGIHQAAIHGHDDLRFNPPRSAGSGESTGAIVSADAERVSIRPGARALGNHRLRPPPRPRRSFNPPRSAGSGESWPSPPSSWSYSFQSAPERGLRGIRDRDDDAFQQRVSIRPGARAPGNPFERT